MSILMWIFVGFVAGFLTSKFINETGKGLLFDVGLGMVGAVVAGWFFTTFATPSGNEVSLYGVVAALTGGVVLLVAYRSFFLPRARP
jgi:uncharacterized membrane protein YeaQ/YmgE (transglycosylase-associated protein family)